MNQITLLIPAYKPSDRLISLIKDLQQLDSHKIINTILIVDDGNDKSFDNVFCEVSKYKNVLVIKHAVNLGKGAALKTGFNYILTHFPDVPCIVTADADGQHAPEDILNVAEESIKKQGQYILGVRAFQKDVPLRSKLGNVLTKLIFLFLTGIKLSDTQTGLRSWPAQFAKEALKIPLNRYDFEMECLLRSKLKTHEVPIRTIYEKNNKTSHFNPLFDSMRIYFLLVRFASSSLLTSLSDFMVFAIAYKSNNNILYSIILARFFSVNINFIINKDFVFHHKGSAYIPIIKFYTAAVFMGSLSYFIINTIANHFMHNVILVKFFTEMCLFVFSFLLQREFIFPKKFDNE
ncbi:MAG: bifunctional glycosyltransferase family 2/GtrA family protein [Deltaproteobacteria bacterium]|nr:bifunctional glycosyltransferase family 2/GtrA family protein [Deltaproteobacteria bacterium]